LSIPKHVIEGKIEEVGRRWRRCKQLLYGLKERKRYWKLKAEALDLTPWRTRFTGGCRPVVRQTILIKWQASVSR